MATLFRKFVDRLDRAVGVEIVETLFYEMNAADFLTGVSWPEGMRVERIAPVSTGMLARASGGIDSGMIESRLRSGEACYAAYVNGELAHYSWIKSSGVQPILEAAAECVIHPGEFWIYHCWTEKWARGMRIYPSVLATIVRDYFEERFTTAKIYTTLENGPSQKGILRAGFREASRMRALRVGRFYFKIG
ncbi:MAG: hypothetical protein ACRD4O_14430 [Bryobacteraceae bacterium]